MHFFVATIQIRVIVQVYMCTSIIRFGNLYSIELTFLCLEMTQLLKNG